MTSPACQRLAGGHQSRDREAFVLGLNNNTCLVVRFSKWEITLIYHDIPHLSVYTYIYIYGMFSVVQGSIWVKIISGMHVQVANHGDSFHCAFAQPPHVGISTNVCLWVLRGSR